MKNSKTTINKTAYVAPAANEINVVVRYSFLQSSYQAGSNEQYQEYIFDWNTEAE